MMTRLSCVLALLVLATAAARAADVQDLYVGEVSVENREESSRIDGVGAALRRVVVKVTGRSGDVSNPVVAAAVAAPEPYVQRYEYRAQSEGEPGFGLWVQFEPAAVDAMIGEAGLTPWGRARPETLVWILTERGNGPELIPAETSPAFTGALAGARRRGIPLTTGLLDLEDQVAMPAAQVWAGNLERARVASERYQPGAVLVIRAEDDAQGIWSGRFDLLMSGGGHQWSARSADLALLAADAMDEVADRLAARHLASPVDRDTTPAPTGGGEVASGGDTSGIGLVGPRGSAVRVVVTGVYGVGDYARALGYLSSLDGVHRVDVVHLEGNRVAFDVDIPGGASRMSSAVSLGTTLAPTGYGGYDTELELTLLP